jgi:hypothetical protein
MFGGTSVNALIRRFLDEYAAVPAAWREGLPPPWTPEGRMAQVMDPVGAGDRTAGRGRDGDGDGDGDDSTAMEAFEAALLSCRR